MVFIDNIMPYIIFLSVVILIPIFYTVYNRRKNLKLNNDLEENFGKIPTSEFGLKFDSISSYWLEKIYNEKEGVFIDEITWNDLDLDKIYSRINNCLTSTGEEYLYSKLHEPENSDELITKREMLISILDNDDDLRRDLQNILSKVGKNNYNGLSGFCYDVSSKRIDKTFIYPILALLPLLFVILFFVYPLIGFIGIISAVTLNGIIHYFTSLKIKTELSAIKYFSVLLWGAKKISGRLKECDLEVTEDLDSVYNTFRKIGGKMSSMGQEILSELDIIVEYYQIISLSGIRKYNKIIATIDRNTDQFRKLYTSIGEVDMAISILSYRKSLDFYTYPEFINDNKLVTEAIYHPLIENPVCNSASLSKYNLISGSNASGKSTFIKAVGINTIMAQTINTCTAKSFQINHLHVMTSMAIKDDITSGDSYFISEIKSLKRIVDMLSKRNCLCIIDEILRGTNTIERIAASTSVLNYISSLDCLCMVATHDIELTTLLDGVYRNFHFSEEITDDGVVFDYLIRDGATQTKNAVLLLEYYNFDKIIIANAQEMVMNFENSKKW